MAGLVFALALFAVGMVALAHGRRNNHPPDLAPRTGASTTTIVVPSTTSTITSPTVVTPPDPWQPVAGTAGLDEMTTSAGTVVRVDPARLDVTLVPGTAEPGGNFPEGGAVPVSERPTLVLATNAGFKRVDAHGGELVDGRIVGALVAGVASLVIHTDGTIDVGAWGQTVGPGPENAAIVQNLTLLVDGGLPAADLGRNILQRWGATFQPALPIAVWRSGAGVDSQGRLLWAAGPNLVPAELAQLLVTAGAIRAMQLDINHKWVFASLFLHPDPLRPDLLTARALLADMTPSPNHVLSPGERDFLAIYRRPPRKRDTPS